EWAKAKQLIAEGKDIDYKGAGGKHEFDAAGDVPGSYAFFKVSGTGYESIADMKRPRRTRLVCGWAMRYHKKLAARAAPTGAGPRSFFVGAARAASFFVPSRRSS